MAVKSRVLVSMSPLRDWRTPWPLSKHLLAELALEQAFSSCYSYCVHVRFCATCIFPMRLFIINTFISFSFLLRWKRYVWCEKGFAIISKISAHTWTRCMYSVLCPIHKHCILPCNGDSVYVFRRLNQPDRALSASKRDELCARLMDCLALGRS